MVRVTRGFDSKKIGMYGIEDPIKKQDKEEDSHKQQSMGFHELRAYRDQVELDTTQEILNFLEKSDMSVIDGYQKEELITFYKEKYKKLQKNLS